MEAQQHLLDERKEYVLGEVHSRIAQEFSHS
jgi:hypothetical protein